MTAEQKHADFQRQKAEAEAEAENLRVDAEVRESQRAEAEAREKEAFYKQKTAEDKAKFEQEKRKAQLRQQDYERKKMNDPKVQADLKREGPEWDKAREVFQGPCSPQHQNDHAAHILTSLREANPDLRSYMHALKNAVMQITIGFKGYDSSWNVLIGFDGRFGGTLVVNMDFFLQRTVTELWTL